MVAFDSQSCGELELSVYYQQNNNIFFFGDNQPDMEVVYPYG